MALAKNGLALFENRSAGKASKDFADLVQPHVAVCSEIKRFERLGIWPLELAEFDHSFSAFDIEDHPAWFPC